MSNNLMDHVLMNKLDDELGSAIQSVGGDISGAKGPWDYADIIKNQLGVKCGDDSLPSSLDIKLGPGLKIEEVDGVKYLIATSAALTTCTLNPPTGSHMQPTDEVIAAGTPIQSVLESLFYEILPKMPSLYKGDIIKVDRNGSDKYNEEDVKSGLVPNATYLRLYISSRQEPVYILLSGHGLVNSESGNTPSIPDNPGTPTESYIGGETDYIKVDINNNVITASLTDLGLKRFSDIELELSNKASQESVDNLSKIVNSQTTALNKLSNQMDDLNDKVNAIDLDSLGDISNKLNTIESDLNTKASQDDLNEVSSKVTSLEESISNIESDLGTKASQDDLNEISFKVTALEEYISNIDLDGLGDITNELSNIKSDLDTKASQDDLNEVSSKVTELEESISNIDLDSLGDITNELSNIKSDLDTKASQDDLNEVSSKVTALEESISNIDLDSLENVGTELSNIKSDLGTKASQSDLESLRTQVEANTEDIKNLKASIEGIDLNNLDTRISNLEATSISKQEVESIVDDKLSSAEFANTVQESVTNTLVDETNVEVQEAITQVVEKVVAGDTITEDQANNLVDDIFANV